MPHSSYTWYSAFAPISNFTDNLLLHTILCTLCLTSDKTKSLSIWLVSILNWMPLNYRRHQTHVKSKSLLCSYLSAADCEWTVYLTQFSSVFSTHFPNYKNRSATNKKNFVPNTSSVQKQGKSYLYSLENTENTLNALFCFTNIVPQQQTITFFFSVVFLAKM